jgi:hypothetical protein
MGKARSRDRGVDQIIGGFLSAHYSRRFVAGPMKTTRLGAPGTAGATGRRQARSTVRSIMRCARRAACLDALGLQAGLS